MSLDATRWAWMQKGLRPIHKLVLLSLADRAGADDTSWPSQQQLAFDTGADRKSIQAAINALVAAGLIADTGVRKGSTKQIVVYRMVGVDHREEAQKRNTSENGTLPFFPSKEPKNGLRNLSGNLEENPPTPHRGKRTAVRGLSKEPPAVPERINPLAWADWVAYRRDKRKPISERAAKAQWASLSTLTFDQQAECIATSIANDWQGLFPGKALTASTDPSPIARGGVWK